MKIFVTGANGFVGANLCQHLVASGHEVSAAVRRAGTAPEGTTEVIVADLGPDTNYDGQLEGHDAVIHLAARVHVMSETAQDPLLEFRRVNTFGTRTLAEAAAAQGVKRFVYLSSIKVNGEGTDGTPYRADDTPGPVDPYGVSKLEAEVLLRDPQVISSLDVVLVRAPLVYGPGVGGNYVKMLGLAKSGLPLPLASIRNRRTMVSVWNLVDLLEKAATDAAASGATVLAGDAESPSTPELLRAQARAMAAPIRLFAFPVGLMKAGARLLGRTALVDRLAGSLEVEPGSSTTSWVWRPPVSLDDGITRTAVAFLKNNNEGTV